MTLSTSTATTAEKAGSALAHGAGRILIAPAIAAALDAPDVRSAVRRLAWSTGVAVGVCIAGGIVLGHLFTRD